MVCDCSYGNNPILTAEIKEVIEQSAFVPIATLSGDSQLHLIVVGKAQAVRNNQVVFWYL